MKVALLICAVWAVSATALLFFPNVSHAIDDRVHWRESADGRRFLQGGDQEFEEFVAYGNERQIRCLRRCSVQTEDGGPICYSFPETFDSHICQVKLHGGEHYFVWAEKPRLRERASLDRR